MVNCSNKRYQRALTTLRQDKLRVTQARKTLLQALVKAQRPISAEELYRSMAPGTFDLVTVYRNLETFERAGIAQKVMTESGKGLYELIEANHHYHHILCRKCHRAERLEDCELTHFETLAGALGYSDISHVLELYGLCMDCREGKAVN